MADDPDISFRRSGGAAVSVRLEAGALPSLITIMREFPEDWPDAVSRALNRAAERARTQLKRIVATNMGLKQRDLVPDPATGRMHRWGGLKLTYSTRYTQAAVLTISGRRIPLYYFNARPTRIYGVPRPPGGVRYRIGIGGGKALPHGFLAAGRRGRTGTVESSGSSGHIGVFERWGPKRASWRGRGPEQRIYERFGPSIPHVAERDPEVRMALDMDLTNWIEQRLAGEIQRLTADRTARHQRLREAEVSAQFGLEQAKHAE